MKIVVIMNGGVIQQVLSDEPAKVAIVDYDVESVDECQRTSIQIGDDPSEETFTNRLDANVTPDLATRLYDICNLDSKVRDLKSQAAQTTAEPAPEPKTVQSSTELERVGRELTQALSYWLPAKKPIPYVHDKTGKAHHKKWNEAKLILNRAAQLGLTVAAKTL